MVLVPLKYSQTQGLTYSLGNRNYNAKLNRWKARIEEYNCELLYKPGKSNVVADALSRLPLQLNALDTDSVATVHSSLQDATDFVPHVEAPINVFRNQIIFNSDASAYSLETPFPGYTRHIIPLSDDTRRSLSAILKERLRPTVINGVKIPDAYLQSFQESYRESFSFFKIRIAQKFVKDIVDENEIMLAIDREHSRAHRNAREVRLQLLDSCYFLKMASRIRAFTATCQICKYQKYDRHTNKPFLQPTPIPTRPCEILHIDIFMLEGKKYLSCLDKFSKFAKLFPLEPKSALHLREELVKVLHYFSVPKTMVSDNERGLLCPTVLNFLKTLGIQVYYAPSQRSEVNGQVERFHSTFLEIYRCLKQEYPTCTVNELADISVDRYNNSIHSVTQRKPADVFLNRAATMDLQKLLEIKHREYEDIRGLLQHKQETANNSKNKNKKNK